MSGPNPPGPESEELEPGVEPSEGDSEFEEGGSEFGEGPVEADADGQTGQTDVYSRAYSAPESEHFSSGPYVPVDLDLYDYDSYDDVARRRGGDHSTLAVDRRRRRDCRGDRPGGFGIAAVRAHRHRQVGHARHRAYVDAADAGRDHRHDTAARAASATDQRGAATTPAADQRAATAAAADQRGAAATAPGPSSGPGSCPGPGATGSGRTAARSRRTSSRSPTR